MFIVRVPFIPILREVVSYYRLPYAVAIHEISGVGVELLGIELELPPLFAGDMPRHLFFWAPEGAVGTDPFEAAAAQALRCLQTIYHFSVVDYSSEQLALCTELARHVFSVANSGARLARMVVAEARAGMPCSVPTVSAPEDLLHEVHSIPNSI